MYVIEIRSFIAIVNVIFSPEMYGKIHFSPIKVLVIDVRNNKLNCSFNK